MEGTNEAIVSINALNFKCMLGDSVDLGNSPIGVIDDFS